MSDFHPLVSIVIPVYNGSNFMQKAIDSALGQDYDNCEVIVVNDGSTDDTEEIALGYGDRIRYFAKENGGVATALNLGIKNSNGGYISWLSHDEYFLPNKISRQIAELLKVEVRKYIIPNCEFTTFNILDNSYKQGEHLADFVSIEYSTKLESIKALYSNLLHICCLLIPKEAFDLVGYFDENLYAVQDYQFCIRLINAGYVFLHIPDTLVINIEHLDRSCYVFKKDLLTREAKLVWNMANKLFAKDIKMSSKNDRKIFDMRSYKLHKRIIRKLYHMLNINGS